MTDKIYSIGEKIWHSRDQCYWTVSGFRVGTFHRTALNGMKINGVPVPRCPVGIFYDVEYDKIRTSTFVRCVKVDGHIDLDNDVHCDFEELVL